MWILEIILLTVLGASYQDLLADDRLHVQDERSLGDIQCSYDQATNCPRHKLKHYIDRGCKPDYKDRSCCPVSYDCSRESILGASAASANEVSVGCLYGGRSYRIGDSVQLNDPCRICKCVADPENKGATINCAIMDCPLEMNGPRNPGCSLLYVPGRCCASTVSCEIDEQKGLGNTCTYNNQEYVFGERMKFQDPCRVCVCTRNFTGPQGLGCYDIDCTASRLTFLEKGCIPVYHDRACCPVDWICPDKNKETKSLEEACSLPSDSGPCLAQLSRFYYDAQIGDCRRFTFSGCHGNENNFLTYEDCMSSCKPDLIPGPGISVTPTIEGVRYPRECLQPNRTGPCRAFKERYFFDVQKKACVMFVYGGCRKNDNNFRTQEACEEKCKRARIDSDSSESSEEEGRECFLPRTVGPCRASKTRFFYNSADGKCQKFIYGGCRGNRNNFRSLDKCERKCETQKMMYPIDRALAAQPPIDTSICFLPKVKGNCNVYSPRYYYNVKSSKCRRFYYGGCGMNANNFETFEQCQEACAHAQVNNGTRSQQDDEQEVSRTVTEVKDCVFDGNRFQVGSQLDLKRPCISCTCQIPPVFTCTYKQCPLPPSSSCISQSVPGSCCPIYNCPPLHDATAM